MANIQQLVPILFKWEGGYVNDPADLGGATNKGVTLSTWKQQGYDKNGDGVIDVEDLKLISNDDVVERILRPHYWNRWQADRIRSQALANILVDWVWGSGRWGIVIPQRILKVKQDGFVGEETLSALNRHPDPKALFEEIKQERKAFLERISVSRPANWRFLKGWLNRLNDFRWIPMALLFCALLSCKVTKEEMKAERYKVKGEKEIEVNTDKKSNLEQHATLSQDQAERKTTEIVTAEFDTLDSKPILKKLRIERTVADRAVHAEQQVESHASGAEVKGERLKVKGEKEIEIHSEKKSKTEPSRAGWWMAAGAAIVLLLLFWVWKRICLC